MTVNKGFACIASYSDDAITIIDVEIPKKPTFAAVIKGAGAPNYLAGPTGIFINNDYAYIASSEDSALSIIDLIEPRTQLLQVISAVKASQTILKGLLMLR